MTKDQRIARAKLLAHNQIEIKQKIAILANSHERLEEEIGELLGNIDLEDDELLTLMMRAAI